MKRKRNEKILIGMSGGIDSSVSAYLLKKQGYDVIGVTLQLWEEYQENSKEPSVASLEDIRKIAKSLDIPFYILNMKEEFKKFVIDYFIKEYETGRTPNPCIVCNRYVKFQALLNKAKSMGIGYIATGHYARIEEKNNRYLLKEGKEIQKDQSYFLYKLTQDQLARCIFPLGRYKKSEVKEYAKQLGIGIPNQPESQEICFVKNNHHSQFIQKHSKKNSSRGEIVDTKGNILGYHNGITKYTIGQRKGLGISAGKPLFVLKIDNRLNRIVVGSDNKLYKQNLIATDLNWIYIDKLEKDIKIKAKIRYGGKKQTAKLIPINNNRVKVLFKKKQRAITKGQSVVFYKGKYVLGGGIITE
jgi:tRNA-uridine 2-sulfurtransferase